MPQHRRWLPTLAAAALLTLLAACAPPGVVRAAKPVIEPPPDTPYPRVASADVSLDGGECRLDAAAGVAEGAFAPDLNLRGDPGFDPADLPPDVRCWYEALWGVIEDPDRAAFYTYRASRNDLYTYAREINNHLLGILTAFRVTGDLALLDEVDRLTQHMRAQLDDTWHGAASLERGSIDGHLNWVWDQEGAPEYRGKDTHEIDEMRTHSGLAQVAYAFAQNADLQSPNGVDYAERASFWLEYLRDDFEAKWRERHDVPWPRFPFIERPHLHETFEFVRYHHYLYLLTGEAAYEREAERLTEVVFDNFRVADTEAGPALVTPRSVLSMGGSLEYLIPSVYFRHVLATAVDLYLEGVGPWADDEVMAELARTLSEFIIDDGADSFARDVGGGRPLAGLQPSGEDDWGRLSPNVYNISPFALMAAWDATGEVASVSGEVFATRAADIRGVYVPVGMMLDAALGGGSLVTLGRDR